MTNNQTVGADWLQEQMKRGEPIFFIEVRHAGDLDLAVMKVRGALRLDSDQAQKPDLNEIPKERNVVIYSTAPGDEPAAGLAQLLLNQGVKEVHVLSGGFKAYLRAGLPVEEIGSGRSMTRGRGL
jgi:rhodanese-related sulfurtransferase